MTVPSTRAGLDVSHLPTSAFGPADVPWWATIWFMVVEGTTLIVAIAAYFFVRGNFATWPPERTPLPALLIPTVGVLVAVASIPLVQRLDRAAHRKDLPALRRLLLASVAVSVVYVVLRALDLRALGVRWDTNAYGSTAWLVLALHGTLVAVDLLETIVLAVLVHLGPVEEKHYSDVADAALYWYFLIAGWVLTYLVIFVSPRLIP